MTNNCQTKTIPLFYIWSVIGNIYIKGDIGSYEDEQGNFIKGVDLQDVMADVNDRRKEGATSFKVEVNSLGGFCDVGFSIYNFLKTIPETIETVAVNNCASIATVIFLAGDKRTALCPLMIHNPWISKVSGDADQMQEATDIIKAEEDKLISFYSKVTGLEKGALDDLMKRETYIYPDLALRLGFTTEQTIEKVNTAVAYKAVAKINDNMSKEAKTLIAKLGDLLNKFDKKDIKPKALQVTDDSGVTMEITNADGSDITGMPVAGNLVSIDGQPANGTFVVTEMGVTIEVMEGLITMVSEIAVEDKSLETANKKIEELIKENETLKATLEESKKDFEEVTNKVNEFETVLSKMKGNSPDIQAKQTFRKVEEPTVGRSLKNLDERREELRLKREGK